VLRSFAVLALTALVQQSACRTGASHEGLPDAGGSTASGERLVGGRCQSAFTCSGVACDDYETQLRNVRESMQLECKFRPTTCAATGEAGRCGDARYVRFHDPSGSQAYYFAADGKPLARREESPANIFCDRRASACDYGVLPACTPVLTEDFVPASPTPRLGTRDAGR
jgi:hypothetical protein